MSQSTSEIDDKKFSEKDQDFCQYLLTLLDGQFKKVAVNAYALQMANTRNYLWIFFVVLSFAAAFFKEADLGSVIVKLFAEKALSIPCIFLLLFFFSVVVTAVIGFWVGINSVSSSYLPFPYQNLHENFVDFEVNGSKLSDRYVLTRVLLDKTYISLLQVYENLESRGKKLRLLSRLFKSTLIFSVLIILFLGIVSLN